MKTISPIILALLFCLSTGLKSQANIIVTFNVDMTGQTLGPGGMHIAGTFASAGSSTILTDWAPGASGSALTLLSGNIYSIVISFPSSSVGYPLQFLFVRDSIWWNGIEDFSEGNPGITFLNYNCGTDDGGGGFNRLLNIPFSNATFKATFDHCGTLVACMMPTNLQTTNISSSSAQLNWTPVTVGIDYKIRYREQGGSWKLITVSGITTSSYTLSALTASTVYQWQMLSRCAFGPSVWTNISSFHTALQKISGDVNTPSGIGIYPNPSFGKFTLTREVDSGKPAKIMVTDVLGNIVLEDEIEANDQKAIHSYDLTDQKAGMYFIRVNVDGAIVVRQLELLK